MAYSYSYSYSYCDIAVTGSKSAARRAGYRPKPKPTAIEKAKPRLAPSEEIGMDQSRPKTVAMVRYR